MMPPPTPDLPGRPTRTNHSPASSYMPQEFITDSTRSTVTGSMTRSSVNGLRPPAARVAPMIARSRVSTMTEHWAK